MSFHLKPFKPYLSGLVIGLVLAAGFSVFAWTAPTSAPPLNNVASPLNVGSTSQTKTGSLGVGNLNSINNVSYSWPSIQGAANSTLINNGAGTLSWGSGGLWVTSGANIYSANAGNVLIGSAGTGKLTVGTIDPIYEIDGKKYATYVGDFAGGVIIETAGVINTKNGIYEIDFNKQAKGSNLWLFWQASSKNINAISILLTPAFNGNTWYEKDAKNNKIMIQSSKDGEVSFRLTAPRKDAPQWKNEIKE